MEHALDAMLKILDQIDVLCVPSVEKSKEFHQNLKDLFDLSIQASPQVELGPLMELYIKNMDSESIWEQVQSRNRPLNRYMEQNAKKLYQSVPSADTRSNPIEKKNNSSIKKHIPVEDSALYSDDSDGTMHDSEEEEHSDHDDDSDDSEDSDDSAAHDDGENDGTNDELISEGEEMESWLDDMDEAEAVRLEVSIFHYVCVAHHPCIILPLFYFAFLHFLVLYVSLLRQKQHGKSEKRNNYDEDDNEDEDGDENDGEDDDDDEAFVQRELYALDSGSSEDGSDDEVNANDAKFNNFFSSSKRGKISKSKLPSRRDTALRKDEDSAEEDESEDDDDDEEEDDDDEEDKDNSQDENEEVVAETNYSRKKSKLQEQISLLEENAIGAKSWEVAGEVKSSQRPENSLLGIPVDVER